MTQDERVGRQKLSKRAAGRHRPRGAGRRARAQRAALGLATPGRCERRSNGGGVTPSVQFPLPGQRPGAARRHRSAAGPPRHLNKKAPPSCGRCARRRRGGRAGGARARSPGPHRATRSAARAANAACAAAIGAHRALQGTPIAAPGVELGTGKNMAGSSPSVAGRRQAAGYSGPAGAPGGPGGQYVVHRGSSYT